MTVKGLFKARLQKKPWIEGSSKCLTCDRRFLLDPCRDRCAVITEYQLSKGLLFINRGNLGLDQKSAIKNQK
jgi:hypothetical protein